MATANRWDKKLADSMLTEIGDTIYKAVFTAQRQVSVMQYHDVFAEDAFVMTLRQGIIFRINGPFWGKAQVPQMAGNAELDIFVSLDKVLTNSCIAGEMECLNATMTSFNGRVS